MRLTETLRMIWTNLLQNKSKVLLTSLGIIIGTLTIILVIAIGKGGEEEVARQYSTTWQAVERNIRAAADRAWRCNPALLTELAGHPLGEPPTASQLIAILAGWYEKEGAGEESGR